VGIIYKFRKVLKSAMEDAVAPGQECCCNKATEDEVEGSGIMLEWTCGRRGG
jgi:hypothetical protein